MSTYYALSEEDGKVLAGWVPSKRQPMIPILRVIDNETGSGYGGTRSVARYWFKTEQNPEHVLKIPEAA